MWFWIISAIAGSILGNAVDSWFSETKLGVWFYGKVADISDWAAKKLKLQTLSKEEVWKKKYPNRYTLIRSLLTSVTYCINPFMICTSSANDHRT